MSLVIALGSNLGNRKDNLLLAKQKLCLMFELVAESRIYFSEAQDFQSQPDFLNQVLEFKIPNADPLETMQHLLDIEKELGRKREFKFGPRLIDIDMLYWNDSSINTEILKVPHPLIRERSFVVRPLLELPFGQKINQANPFALSFKIEAFVYEN